MTVLIKDGLNGVITLIFLTWDKMHNWLDTILEAYIAYILTREYYWGRSDTDLKREEKRREARKKRVVPQQISHSSGQKDVEMGTPAPNSTTKSPDQQGNLEVRGLPQGSVTYKLCDSPGPESKKD